MSVDPITGLPIGEDTAPVPRRPQSPLVRGTHLDRSGDRFKKRSAIASQVDNDLMQLPAKRDELQGFIPPAYDVVRPKDKLDHVVDAIQCVIDGKEEFVSEEELLLSHPPNLEKTRFTMSKKKLKLQFMEDVLDRFEDERWLYPDQFDRKRKLWHKSIARSLKFINNFLDKEKSNGDYVRPRGQDESIGNTSMGSASTRASTKNSERGRPKTKSVVAPKKRGRKAKESTAEDGLASISKLTLPAPAKKIPKKAAAKESNPPAAASDGAASKKPTFGRKKKDPGNTDETEKSVVEKEKNVVVEKEKTKRGKKKASADEDGEASSPKKSKPDGGDGEGVTTKKAPAAKVKKPAFGAPKRGKKGAGSVESKAVEEVADTAPAVVSGDGELMEKEKEPPMKKEHVEETGGDIEMRKVDDMHKSFEVYDNIDEVVEQPVAPRSQKTASQSVPTIPIAVDDDGMETDDEVWEPNDAPRELTPPRRLLSSQDAGPSVPSSILSQSSQSLFGSLSSSLMGSPNTSFSSQSSSLLPPPRVPSFDLSSSLIPSQLSQPLATSTQIPMSQELIKAEDSEKKEKKPASSGPRVRPMFGKKK